MFWYLPPLKTCKVVPISLNHIWLGAKQFPHRVHPKKRLALEFEPHCQSNLLVARGHRGGCARARAHASALALHPCARAARASQCPRHPCKFLHTGVTKEARGPAARNRRCACAASGPAVRRKRGCCPRAGGGAQLPCARARACASAPAHNTSIACRAYAM